MALGAACDWGNVDDSWDAWSEGAESGLFRAFCRPGALLHLVFRPFLGVDCVFVDVVLGEGCWW